MKVIISGGSGFLGTALTRELAARRHDVVILSRRPGSPAPNVRFVVWRPDTTKSVTQPPPEWPREVDGADAIVNLAGAGIADRRWTTARKQLLRDSRIAATRQLVSAVRAAARTPSVFVSASGIGYYGTTGDEILDESSPAGRDFLASLCVAWEAEARTAEAHGCRVAIVRNGIALARDGGALAKMLLPFQLGLGGPIASGRQYMSWIHRDDWVSLVVWILETSAARGPFNATAPDPVTNAEFVRELGAALHRPAVLPMPGFALRLLVGELADAGLINGQRVVPKRALDLGFPFKYADIHSAMPAAIGRIQ
jgi:uncharacterized protein (TIGR01777 family)